MKRIVIDAREIQTSTGRYIERLLHYLQEVDTDLSHRYSILLKPDDMEAWKPTSKRFTPVSCPYKEFTFAEQLGLLTQIRHLKPDLVHFGMVQQPILYTGRVVTTMHDLTTLRFPNPSKNKLVFKTKQRAYRLVNYVAAHKSRIIITPSQFVKDDVAKLMRINSRKIEVTYEAGTRIEAEAEPIPTLVDTQFIMYVGRPNPHKNLERLIDAFVLLQASHPDLHLVLAGKKDELFKRHARRVSQSEITNVDFTDRVSDGQLRWLYENCAAYVFPSLSEGFGLPGLEAMAHGAPVVSSNVTCLPEIYGEAAHYFDPLDTEAMCIAINDVLDNTRLRNRLLAASSDQIKKYSWKKMAEQTLKVYIRALE